MADDTGADDVRRWIGAEPARPSDQPELAGQLQRLCRAVARALPATGVGVCLMSPAGAHVTAAASDDASAVLEDLQLTLGEGPCLDAYAAGRPVLEPDLAAATGGRWLGYGPAALEQGVRAVFAFPLMAGTSALGAIDVYQDRVGPLSTEAVDRALGFAEVASTDLLAAQQRAGDEGAAAEPDALDSGYIIYQAQGMVMVHLGTDLDDAMSRLRAYAFATGHPLSTVAEGIVTRRLVLEADSPDDGTAAVDDDGRSQ